ncbi:hypothetical protein HHK36_029289 [Tetracentron sinense]|uniref:Uncharacterized protein n=1 Tax=Tetracentron sinense TaxID=13715 RepID=A0A835D1G3_TETSI|nr:hypothetical protein HHK36_029289 [Tetracentron sinense]
MQSRPIFNKSTRFEDMRNFDDERVTFRRPSSKKPMTKAGGLESRDDDLDLADFSQILIYKARSTEGVQKPFKRYEFQERLNEIDFDYKEYARQSFQQYWLRKPKLLASSGVPRDDGVNNDCLS